jgi:hypothetical protein
MESCVKCSIFREKWFEAKEATAEAREQYGSLAVETSLALTAEIKARQKWVAHCAGCEDGTAELLQLLSADRHKSENKVLGL